MIKQALEYIVGLKKPEIHEIGGEEYSDKPLHRIREIPRPKSLGLTTLTSLMEYVNSNIDGFVEYPTIIHVKSPTRVVVYSALDADMERNCYAEVNAQLPSIRYNDFIEHEKFCIMLQSTFEATEERELLLKFAGTVEAGSVSSYGDDGITQKATIKKGIASKEDALIPSPILLKPFRTFHEVEQPASSFVFRMKEGFDNSIGCAIFEADGGAWQRIAMRNIAKYIKSNLIPEHSGVIVIA